ncbi:MAG: glycine cleavage system protein GcvH [candidate division Zixibacteria bacterium]|nr:glycine cleavage system protein GcvH [candidate division Zixibacteria bacterium]NIR66489.1 glycine cleavage system protein GcvH [candidate division Zixibacteria bacterium]NIS16297.1 glycine cleavage system protein GcvH [candidate division Zixibacteria bacterium]NIS47433.1 glycine cleavage system protein GcvH [candidate division Zixibacteria bacterium]NIT52670.1 glycine cleavage system protein GcvH [candidate division Zixibacteria bacterium]
MDFPKDLKYSKEHEWIKVDGDTATIGITDYAQGELGDVVFVELPETGEEFKQMDAFGTIEAVKAVSELYTPVSGEIVEINDKLEDEAGLVNQDCYGDGWMIKIKLSNPSELDDLLDADKYKELVE